MTTLFKKFKTPGPSQLRVLPGDTQPAYGSESAEWKKKGSGESGGSDASGPAWKPQKSWTQKLAEAAGGVSRSLRISMNVVRKRTSSSGSETSESHSDVGVIYVSSGSDNQSINSYVAQSIPEIPDKVFSDNDEFMDDPAYKEYIQSVLTCENIKILLEERKSISSRTSEQDNLNWAAKFRDMLLQECWRYAQDKIEEKERARQKEFDEVEARYSGLEAEAIKIRNQGVAFKTTMLQQMQALRDSYEGAGDEKTQKMSAACRAEILDPMPHLDEEVQKLVKTCVSEQLRRLFEKIDDSTSSDSVLVSMIQNKVSERTQEGTQSLQTRLGVLAKSKAKLVADVCDLAKCVTDKKTLKAGHAKTGDDIQEAFGRLKLLRSDCEEAQQTAMMWEQKCELYRLEAEAARKEVADMGATLKKFEDMNEARKEVEDMNQDQNVLLAPDESNNDKSEGSDGEGSDEDSKQSKKNSIDINQETACIDSRPLLPGASSSALLAHAEGLRDKLDENQSKVSDFMSCLGKLASKSDDEFLKMLSKIPLDDTLNFFSGRLEVARSEGASARSACASLVEEIIALSGIADGRGNSQTKMNQLSKRLQVILQCFRCHADVCLQASRQRARHLEDAKQQAADLMSGDSSPVGLTKDEEAELEDLANTLGSAGNAEDGVSTKTLGKKRRLTQVLVGVMPDFAEPCPSSGSNMKVQQPMSPTTRSPQAQPLRRRHSDVTSARKNTMLLELEQPAVVLRTGSPGFSKTQAETAGSPSIRKPAVAVGGAADNGVAKPTRRATVTLTPGSVNPIATVSPNNAAVATPTRRATVTLTPGSVNPIATVSPNNAAGSTFKSAKQVPSPNTGKGTMAKGGLAAIGMKATSSNAMPVVASEDSSKLLKSEGERPNRRHSVG